MSEHTRVLLSDRVARGHCVIINHCEQPCGKLVAVVTDMEVGKVTAKYLCRDLEMKTCWNSRSYLVTPVNCFGMRIHVANGVYWAERDETLPISASYADGDLRRWQEYGGPLRWVARPRVLAVALGALAVALEAAKAVEE